MQNGVKEIPIEERDESEVSLVRGMTKSGIISEVKVTPEGAFGRNPAFDVTPAKLVTGLITERGVCAASEEGLKSLFPDYKNV